MDLILSALQQTGDGIGIIDLSGFLLFSNNAFAEMHGYTVDEIAGIHVSAFHKPEDMPCVTAANEQVFSAGSFCGEIIHLRKDGSTFPALMQSSLVKDDHGKPLGIVGALQDISDLKSSMSELEETKTLLHSVLDAIPDVIGIQDTEHGVISYNAAGYAYLNLTSEQTKGKKCFELIGHDIPCAKCATSLTYKSLKPERVEKYVPELGTWLDVRAYPILNESGELVKVIEHLRDVTEQKETELKNKQLEEQVRTTQKLESLGVLAGGIAHDFNNILMAILGNADLALAEDDTESVRKYLRDIIVASRRAADLAGQMLDYSGRSEPQKTLVNINGIIRETAVMLGVSVSRKTTLQYNLGTDIPSVFADPVQLQQVFMNLITNASEALENKTGTVVLSTSLELCRCGELANSYVNDSLPTGYYVVIKVQDTGCGMAADTVSRIFDPFFTTKFTGRGLGLAAVLGVIRAHLGAVSVSSEVGKGSQFTIYLPASGKGSSIREASEEEAGTTGTGSVLVVDDEETVRLVTGKMLIRLGYRVEYACNGREAVDIFSRSPEKFVCVLLDLTMPVMDGIEASRKIREISPEAKIVVSSGFTRDAIMKEFSDISLVGVLHKPYSLNDISHIMKKIMSL